ncbi:MAG: hypothetical protein ACYC3A_02290 [Halothiobacillus sp.]
MGYRQTVWAAAHFRFIFMALLLGAGKVINVRQSPFFSRPAVAGLITLNVLLGGLLAGCGQKGPLILPPQTHAVPSGVPTPIAPASTQSTPPTRDQPPAS